MAVICLFAIVIITCAPVVAQSSAEFTLKGDELVDQGKYQEAITAYDQAIALEPKNARAWGGKGVALNQLGNYTEANEVLDEAVAISPAYAKAWYEKGNALYGLGRYDEAITAYDKALEISPEYAYLTYYGKANALSGMGNYTGAIPLYDKALSLEPRYPGPWTMKGNALAASGDKQGAIVAYDKALSLDPNYQLALKGRQAAAASISTTVTGTQVTQQQPTKTLNTSATSPITSPLTTTTRKTPLSFLVVLVGIIAASYIVLKRKI